MYRIKPKKGYNVILKDIGLTLRADKDEWIEVDKELFDNSMDAKRSKSLIVFENETNKTEKSKKVSETQPNNESVYSVPESTFVVGSRTYKNPDDVFVKTQNNIIDPIIQESEINSDLNNIKDHETSETTEKIETEKVKADNTEKKEKAKTEKVEPKVAKDNKPKEKASKKEEKNNKK